MKGSMESVLDCVLPYIHDGDDLNSISLVSRKFYDLDCITRKQLTIHVFYASNPSTLSNRFPSIESLALKGLPDINSFDVLTQISATPWIKEISAKFDCLNALCIRHMLVSDQDLELLAKTRGKDLQTLKIWECHGFSQKGLVHVSRYCNDLRSLCVEYGEMEYDEMDGHETGQWLRELALRTPIESLHFRCLYNGHDEIDVEDLTLVARNCSSSLVSLKITPKPPNHLRDAFTHAIKLEDFDGVIFDKNGDYTSFKFPPSIRTLAIKNLPATSFSLLLPYVNQLRDLNLKCAFKEHCLCFLIERCPNLEVLCTDDECGDVGLRVIGQVCKKLQKLTYLGEVTHMGLIALVQGCTSLEFLDVALLDISNEAFEYVGTHLKNLRELRMKLCKKGTDLPLDNGIGAMLKGCLKLKRLSLSLCDGGLTDVGFGYIGKYGLNIRNLFLSCKGVSVAGLLRLSKGCPKLRKLYLENCPFSEQAVAAYMFRIHSLRYVWVHDRHEPVLALTRTTVTAQVLTELTPYVTLAEKLQKLAGQLVADGSGLGSVTITYTSSRATDNLDTPLVRAMLAKGIFVNGEQVIVDGSSDKPLEIIKVQIANAESRLGGEIKVEGRVKDGVPHLTKVGVLNVDVSLEGSIILCRQAPHQPNIITSVSSILNHENVNVTSMSFGSIEQYNIMVIGVDEKPRIKALNKIVQISAADEFVFLTF